MGSNATWLALGVVAALLFAIFLLWRLEALSRGRAGRILLLGALLVVPLFAMGTGVTATLHKSKSREFCGSCHEMRFYEKSLLIDDSSFLPAAHFQKRLVPSETACFECHSDYTLYGDVSAKFNGMKYAAIHFFGDVPEPGKVALYSPFPNDNCLRCHRGSRAFESKDPHNGPDAGLERLYGNEVSCLTKGCHDLGHGIADLGNMDFWKPSEHAAKAMGIDLEKLEGLELPKTEGSGDLDDWD